MSKVKKDLEMSPEQAAKVKEILIAARERLSEKNPYPETCITVVDPMWRRNANIVLAYEYLKSQKPTPTVVDPTRPGVILSEGVNTLFIKSKHWTGDQRFWWGLHRNGQPKGLLDEVRRFMDVIAAKL